MGAKLKLIIIQFGSLQEHSLYKSARFQLKIKTIHFIDLMNGDVNKIESQYCRVDCGRMKSNGIFQFYSEKNKQTEVGSFPFFFLLPFKSIYIFGIKCIFEIVQSFKGKEYLDGLFTILSLYFLCLFFFIQCSIFISAPNSLI